MCVCVSVPFTKRARLCPASLRAAARRCPPACPLVPSPLFRIASPAGCPQSPLSFPVTLVRPTAPETRGAAISCCAALQLRVDGASLATMPIAATLCPVLLHGSLPRCCRAPTYCPSTDAAANPVLALCSPPQPTPADLGVPACRAAAISLLLWPRARARRRRSPPRRMRVLTSTQSWRRPYSRRAARG